VSADIEPDDYPHMLDVVEATRRLKALRTPATLARAGEAIEAAALPIGAAVRTYVDALAQGGNDPARVMMLVHKIRGLVDIAGLPVTGQICDGLCRHMEEAFGAADPTVVALHVDAIIRAARCEPQQPGAGEEVAARLAQQIAQYRAAADAAGQPQLKRR
jgi:hypothetical protein